MQTRTSLASALVSLLAIAAAAWAHHSPSAEFDMAKRVSLTGTLTKIDWVNPHIVAFLEAKGADGATENWRMESNPPAWFRRVGVSRNDLAKGIGQTVTVEGNRAKDGNLYMYMLKITFADGSSLELVNNAVTEASTQ
ncbi:MAG TPA: DUF6152 family protein [Bryobacteraceae bacterium]|nr:DUF6152 family protein [Bryobacteraceae bacterium]